MKNLFRIFSISFLLLFCLRTASFAQASFPNKVISIVQPGAVNPDEVSIAINPKNPKQVVAVSMQREFPDGKPGITNYAYFSNNGGLTWKTVAQHNKQRKIQGDDAVTYGANGMAYHSYIAFKGLYVKRPHNPMTGIYVSATNNNGKTWTMPVPVVDHINVNFPFEDKPYLVTDNNPDSKFKNNLYLSWTHFAVYGSHNPADSSQIYFSRSTNNGKSFSMPIRISTTGGDCVDSSNTVEGAVPAVGTKGQIYVVWAGPKGLVFTKSLDGGLTFRKEKVIGKVVKGWDFNVPGIDRCNGMPIVSVDRSHGPYRGSIYVNWVDRRYGDPDVFCIYSRNGGKTWSHPVRVNNDPRGNGKDQFFTWMAIDPVDGSVNIVFYDRRNYNGTETGLTLARSIDGGKTFRNFKINQKPFTCNKHVFFGDYNGITAYDGHVIPIFTTFTGKKSLGVSVALFHFKPGTFQPVK